MELELNDDIEFLRNELYASLVDMARMRRQIADLLPAALIGAGVMTGAVRVHVKPNAEPNPQYEDLYCRIQEGEFGEVE